MLKAALLMSDVEADVLPDGSQVVEMSFNPGKLVATLVVSIASAAVGIFCGKR